MVTTTVRRAGLCLALGLVSLGAPAHAQGPRNAETLTVRGPQPKLLKLGEAAVVEFVINSAQVQPAPLKVPPVENLRYALSGPSRSRSSSSFNGRESFSSSTTYRLKIVPSAVGKFTIPSFSWQTGTRTQTVPKLELEVVKDVASAMNGFARLVATPERVYVGEPVRFEFEVGVDKRMTVSQVQRQRTVIDEVSVVAPWFRESEGFVSAGEGADDIELPAGNRSERRVVIWNEETARYAAFTPGNDSEDVSRYVFSETLIPTAAGTIEVPAPLVTLQVRGRARQDVFGRLTYQKVPRYLYAEPLTVEVVPVPSEGRPASYSNAVGRFTVEARASVQEVRVGDSVKLEFVVTGEGNLEFLGVPEFPVTEGFHVLGSNSDRGAGEVRVTYDLTPVDTTPQALPSIRWSYFDTTPGVERFVEVSTDSIPIRVLPAPEGAGLALLPGEEDRAVLLGEDDIFDIKPLDLGEAVEVPPTRGAGSTVTALAAVFGPWLLVVALGLGFGRRKRARADVLGRRAAGARMNFQKVLKDRRDATAALVGYLADRLGTAEAAVIGPDLSDRLETSGVDADLAADVQQAIDAGTAARYGGGSGLDATRAEALVGRLEAVRMTRSGPRTTSSSSAVSALLASMLLVCATGSAQEGAPARPGDGVAGEVAPEETLPADLMLDRDILEDAAGRTDSGRRDSGRTDSGRTDLGRITPADPEAAYRRGDYPVAIAGFLSKLETPGADQRLFYNLGNAYFRDGQFAEALAAFESARRAMPRDPELLANLALTERRLELAATGEGESFVDSIAALRGALTAGEVVLLAAVFNLLAAAALWLTRGSLRWILVFITGVPALLFALEILLWAPARAPKAVVLPARLEVVSEPRDGLEAVLRLRRGVRVEVLGKTEAWANVRVQGRRGFVRRDALRVIR